MKIQYYSYCFSYLKKNFVNNSTKFFKIFTFWNFWIFCVSYKPRFHKVRKLRQNTKYIIKNLLNFFSTKNTLKKNCFIFSFLYHSFYIFSFFFLSKSKTKRNEQIKKKTKKYGWFFLLRHRRRLLRQRSFYFNNRQRSSSE